MLKASASTPGFWQPLLCRTPGLSPPPMTEPEQWPRGGLRSAGTRPVNFVVQSPTSVGSGRCGFKRPGDFESGKAGGQALGRPRRGEPPARSVPGPERGRAALSPASRPALPRAQPVTRAPISWWILLKRPRSPRRTKAIVSLPPAAPRPSRKAPS